MEALALRHSLARRDIAGLPDTIDVERPDAWLVRAGGQIGIEALPAQVRVREIDAFLLHGAPALIRVETGDKHGVLALDRRRGGAPAFLCPDGRLIPVDARAVGPLLAHDHAQKVAPEVERIITIAGVSADRSRHVASALTAERIGDEEVAGLTMLRLPASADFAKQFRLAGLPLRLAQVAGLFVLLYGAELWSWSLIGGATLSGNLDWGWLTAWVLLGFTMVPAQLIAGWSEAIFSLETGRLIKSRLLAGALALPPDGVKREGVGALIGKVMESQALEGLVLGGAFSVLIGAIELGFAFWVLALGAAPSLHVLLLAAWVIGTAAMGLSYHRRIVAWTRARLRMTDYLVEAMVGHRTRLAQERADRRDTAEDSQLAAYQTRAVGMDRVALQVGAGVASLWQIVAILALGPSLVAGTAPSTTSLAISLGGILLAQRALGAISGGLSSLSRAGFAWSQVRTIFRGGGCSDVPQSLLIPRNSRETPAGPVLEGRNVGYTHQGDIRPVLAGVDFTINRGDTILIEGPSGGGKSTLACLLTGLRPADSGMMLLDGLDRHTIGDDWHDRVTSAPQFHDNHILSGTLAFNLLMGRQWPPTSADLKDAQALCERLGLGDLLARMPGGLHQQVGETGWQLSHGERSRIFLARALLQKAQVTILDESFASLDPATLDRCLTTALEEAETLIVIAHP